MGLGLGVSGRFPHPSAPQKRKTLAPKRQYPGRPSQPPWGHHPPLQRQPPGRPCQLPQGYTHHTPLDRPAIVWVPVLLNFRGQLLWSPTWLGVCL